MPEQSEQSGHEGGLNTPLVNHLHNTQELVSAHELLVNAQELLVSAQERLMRAHELLVRAQELSLTIQELLSKTQKLLKNTQCLLVIHKNCRSMHSTHLFAMYQQQSMHSQSVPRTCLRCIILLLFGSNTAIEPAPEQQTGCKQSVNRQTDIQTDRQTDR